MKKIDWKYSLLVILGGIVVLTFRPVPIQKEKNSLSTTGIVEKIYEGGVKDVVFKLKGQDRIYYINRGLQYGLDLQTLQTNLTNNEITLIYPRYWIPLDPFNSFKHVTKLVYKDSTLYSQID